MSARWSAALVPALLLVACNSRDVPLMTPDLGEHGYIRWTDGKERWQFEGKLPIEVFENYVRLRFPEGGVYIIPRERVVYMGRKFDAAKVE